MVRVRVPATSANLGAGFDCFGMAWQLYNDVEVEQADRSSLHIEGEGADSLPRDRSNLVWMALSRYYEVTGRGMPCLHVRMVNRIPIARGLGSSSAVIIGALTAANALSGGLLDKGDLLDVAVAMEGHPDNVAPALHGGLVVGAMNGHRALVTPVPVPPELRAVVFVPDFSMLTEQARAILPPEVPRADAVFNLSRSALFVAAMATGNLSVLREAMRDRLHPPYRQVMFPGMARLIECAVDAGAVGACLSGAGSAILALTTGSGDAIGQAMSREAVRLGVRGDVIALEVCTRGAHLY